MTTKTDDEDSSRRNFIRKSVAVGMGITLNSIDVSESVGHEDGKEKVDLSDKAKKLMALFNLKYPIFQAAPGGDALAIAVSNAGAMGAMALTSSTPEDAYRRVTSVKEATHGNFYVNYILHFDPSSLDKALEAGAPTVQFSWGIPDKTMVSKIRAANAKLGIQVASKDGAKAAVDLNPDFLICQGVEAGGHVQANDPLMGTLGDVLEVAKNIPVLAAGGIATGQGIRTALKAGASGAVLGTRLIATQESEIHSEYKNALVKAGDNSTVFTICFDKGWPALHRVLKNNTFQRWESAGCPLPGRRPGENDIVAIRPNGTNVERYSVQPPLEGFRGEITELAMYAGQGVKNIKDLPSAGDLILRLWKEFENK